MGCGKGMILYKVASAPCVEEYVGCDLSRLAVKHVERVWKSHVATPESGVQCALSTHVRDASNFAGLADKGYDAVVCNGVSMYFPSASYLVDVLLAGLPKLDPNRGIYHFGDVISREHYKSFLLRRARFFTHTYDELQSQSARDDLFSSAKDRCFEQELFFALQLADRLPGVAAVEVQLKHGKIMSEFNRYRYNVLLHLGPKPEQPLDVHSIPESDVAARASAASVASRLAALATASPESVVACHGLPERSSRGRCAAARRCRGRARAGRADRRRRRWRHRPAGTARRAQGGPPGVSRGAPVGAQWQGRADGRVRDPDRAERAVPGAEEAPFEGDSLAAVGTGVEAMAPRLLAVMRSRRCAARAARRRSRRAWAGKTSSRSPTSSRL